MFSAWVKDEYGEIVKHYEDCMKIAVLSEFDMSIMYPDILQCMEIHCPYLHLVDSTGNHFYPLYIYSVNIG